MVKQKSGSDGSLKENKIFAQDPELYKKCWKMIHAKDYIIYKLTGNMVSDYSDASGTNLFDLVKKEWSQELLDAFEISRDLLPEVHPSTDIAGRVTVEAARLTGLAEGTPVVIGGGDGSCACVGAGVVKEGSAYNVLGSSSWSRIGGYAIYNIHQRMILQYGENFSLNIRSGINQGTYVDIRIPKTAEKSGEE